MKILKRIIIWLLVIVALLVLVAYLLPKTYHVERSTTIKANKDVIFSMACDFNNWDLWSPWSYTEDSTCIFENIGKCEAGAVHKWDGVEMGKGMMKITELIPGEKINWELTFEGYSHVMYIGMTFVPVEDGYAVNWSAEGDLGYNPLFRYYGLMIDSDLGPDYEKGLENLKTLCEKLPDYPGISIVDVKSGPAISIKDSVATADLGLFMETFMPTLYLYAVRMEAKMAYPPYSVYYNWDPEGKVLVEIGMPLQESIEGEGIIKASVTPGGKALTAVYNGPYEEMAVVYEALEQYMKVMNIEPVGHAWEGYLRGPATESDPANFQTIVYFAIK